MASNTGCTSDGEVAMTLRISAVAVCRFEGLLRLGEQPRVLYGDHGLVGECLQKTDFTLREWTLLQPARR